jgi:hypothetical protein
MERGATMLATVDLVRDATKNERNMSDPATMAIDDSIINVFNGFR